MDASARESRKSARQLPSRRRGCEASAASMACEALRFRGFTGQPRGNLLAGPAVIVVQMDEQRSEVQTLLASLAGASLDGVEAVEEPIEIAGRVLTARLSRQAIHRFIRRAERTGSVLTGVVITERLLRPALHAIPDVLRQLTFTVMRFDVVGCHVARPL